MSNNNEALEYNPTDRLNMMAFWLVVFRDFLRVFEYISGINFPFNLIGLAIVSLASVVNFSGRRKSKDAAFFMFMVGLLAVHFLLLFVRNLDSVSDFRALVGLYYVHCAIPLFVVSLALRYDLQALIQRKNFIMTVLFIVCFGISQVVFASIEPSGFGTFLMSLHNEGIIAYPLQTVISGGIQIRTMSVFYSAFAFSLIINWLVAYIIFMKPLKWPYIVLVLALVCVQYTTYNRNGFFMLGYILALRLFMPLFSLRLVAIVAAGIVSALIILGPVLLATFDTGAGGDSSFLLKTSTLQSRVYSWVMISEAPIADWLFGTGFVQGLSQNSTEEFFVDNFFIYLIWQNGLIVALVLSVMLILTLYALLPTRRDDKYGGFVFAVFSAGLLGFSLNIMFFEPLFQLLYLAPAVSLICTRRARKLKQVENSPLIAMGPSQPLYPSIRT
ncbi:hypothetical protein [Devosia sp. MC1541]|uniref:hypothetical protein n=1 Tax=Devosia sp. MC1541 TaxID=2725264 RepID=UPI00145D3D0C|nr:hypothetical protein [Devosia sp. MC1541]